MVSPSTPPINFEVAIHKIVREEWGYLISSLIKSFNDFHMAEDALQDAVEAALINWRKNGLPPSARAWLLTAARRKLIDKIRRDKNFESKKQQFPFFLDNDELKESDYAVPDERLRLIFTCCHPALDHNISVALTLQLLGGLTATEIARAFLVKPETMAQRLVRGKRKIKQAGIPYIIPDQDQFATRLDAVLSVLYLIFNEGYSASSGKKHIRAELCDEAIRLARILLYLCPCEPEAEALLALMLLHNSRKSARFGENGVLVPLEEQDRSKWNMNEINEGIILVEKSLARKQIGVYQIQAAISALHSEASRFKDTNWREIVLLYDELFKLLPTPVIQLNRIVALSYLISPEESIKALEGLKQDIGHYQPYYAALADLYKRSSKNKKAIKYYQKAISLSGNQAEQDFLKQRMSDLISLQKQ
ncbi:MAG: hypothetical protein H6912_07905 [Kordiimonadaceae bacterium]|nr:hypothetical protein [Kordiimonadaceae bacterium]